jgi:hypothetical protein
MPIDEHIKTAAAQIESDFGAFSALIDQWECDNIERLGLKAAA